MDSEPIMPDYSNLLSLFLLVCFSSIMLGSCYQMIIEPGEFLSSVPRYFMNKGKFFAKFTSCGKCVGGWIAFILFPIAFPYPLVWFAPFIHLIAVATTVVFTGLISAYVSSRT